VSPSPVRTMEKSEKFSDYLFAKMGPPNVTSSVHGTELPPKTTERSDAPVELTGYRKWLSDNLMLLVTLSGVLLGVVLGECGIRACGILVSTFH